MADIALNALTAAPSAAPKSAPESAGSDAASATQSFAQTLKERSTPASYRDARSAAKAPAANAETPAQSAETAEQPSADPVAAMLAALLGQNADAAAAPVATAPTETEDSTPPAVVDPALQGAAPIALPAAAPASPAATPASLAGNGNSAPATQEQPAAAPAAPTLGKEAPAASTAKETTATDPLAALGVEDPSTQSSAAIKDSAFGDALAAAQRNVAHLNATQSAPATQSAELPQQVVRTPVGAAGWADDVGQRIGWVAKQDSGRAELVLTPPSMGRVEVSINMNGDQASASFVAANPVAREALQDALPRLREMLAQAGIQLTQADVGTGQQGQAQAQANGQPGQGGRSGTPNYGADTTAASDNESLGGSTLERIRSGRGMVDIFA